MSSQIPADGYDARYAGKLWSLVPAVYRAADSQTPGGHGPLRELLDRVACQVAEVRRSIDRLWEDQSAESCDSWVIPYLADLLATNLVPSMDARGQRLDVANTIYYRRRKGTVALLEQLAADVTGYDARVIEFFRRLGRTRHGLDPPIGYPAGSADPAAARRLQHAENLTGLLTGTPAGGLADLRDPLAASMTGTAYDEYHHRADVRRGTGALGWYGISKAGFFLWRTLALRVDRATPVPVSGCPGHYGADPTGRQIPLFQASARGANDYGESWLPIPAWQLPMPLTTLMWEAIAGASAPDPGPRPTPTRQRPYGRAASPSGPPAPATRSTRPRSASGPRSAGSRCSAARPMSRPATITGCSPGSAPGPMTGAGPARPPPPTRSRRRGSPAGRRSPCRTRSPPSARGARS